MADIKGFEALAYRREAGAEAKLLDVLQALSAGSPIVDDAEPKDGRSPPAQLLTRLAAAIAACLLDPRRELEPGWLQKLAVYKPLLDNVLAASAFRGSGFALQALGRPASFERDRLGPKGRQHVLRFLTLLSIDAEPGFDAAELYRLPPDLALMAVLGLLTAKPVQSEVGDARRERLLECAERLVPAELPGTVDHLVLLSNAFMLCSYARGRGKHRIKATLNRIARGWLQRRKIEAPVLPAARPIRERPTILVAAEIMHSHHVQYRYFGQYLRQLRTAFRLVLVTERREIDEHNMPLFDEHHGFERERAGAYLAKVVEIARAAEPDIVFWPSVGMRHWGTVLANLRLAPIQMTGLGHSASTFCPTVDYYLIEEGYVGDPTLFSETVILLPDETFRFERMPGLVPPAPAIREQARPLRVVLPSNLLKLNPRFLSVLVRIRAAAARPLEFHVFPNVAGVELEAGRVMVQRYLPGATVHPVLRYERYLELLNACDLNLSPFPFGGLHSVVDSLRQGVPVVALEGEEPHARTDTMLLRLLRMPAWLVATTEDEYVAAALRLIDDDALRVEVSRAALACDVDGRLFGDAGTPLGRDVVDAVTWLYRHHEAIQASAKKAWSARERAAFQG